jgi:hypothetical protein
LVNAPFPVKPAPGGAFLRATYRNISPAPPPGGAFLSCVSGKSKDWGDPNGRHDDRQELRGRYFDDFAVVTNSTQAAARGGGTTHLERATASFGPSAAIRSNEIAELRHRDASRREGRPVNAAIHGLGTGSVQAVLEGIRLATNQLGSEATQSGPPMTLGNKRGDNPYLIQFLVGKGPTIPAARATL